MTGKKKRKTKVLEFDFLVSIKNQR